MSTQPQQTTALAKVETSPLILELAGEWKISPATMINTLKATIFPQLDRNDKPVVVTNEMMVAFLQVCNTYKLNPFVKEIYAFPTKSGGIVPMVPIDGWANIINRNKDFDGLEFLDEWETYDGQNGAKIKSLFSTTCIIYRKDRSHAIRVTEYMQECMQPNKEPWKKWPARMLRHKALIQCARIAFSLGGIYDPDEAERIADSTEKPEPAKPGRASAQVIEGQVGTTDSRASSHAGERVEERPETPGRSPAAKSEASVPPSQPQTGGATPAGVSPDKTTTTCICNCCKAGKCDCKGKEEMDQCGCSACLAAVKTPESTAAPSMEDVFNNPPQMMSSQPAGEVLSGKPAGPYVPQEKLKRLFVHAAAAGIKVAKDNHEDALHKMLLKDYGIESITEIPLGLYEEVLEKIAPQLKAAKAGKKK